MEGFTYEKLEAFSFKIKMTVCFKREEEET